MMVKVCGITEREDALAAAASGASAIGFNFYPRSVRYLAPERAAEIGAVLPKNVWRVGIFVDEPAATVEDIARRAGLDIVQLYGGESPNWPRIWRCYRVTAEWTAPDTRGGEEAILLDSPAPGSGSTFDWSVARTIHRPLVLAGGLDDTNVAAAIRAVQPWGVDACSRLESAPGRKNHQKMARFIQAALREVAF